jgi:hypothetical protein
MKVESQRVWYSRRRWSMTGSVITAIPLIHAHLSTLLFEIQTKATRPIWSAETSRPGHRLPLLGFEWLRREPECTMSFTDEDDLQP